MYYAIIATDKPDSLAKRMQARPAHLERLNALDTAGDLLTAGPNPLTDSEESPEGFSGSIIIARFTSLDAAHAWANDDPYVHAGVYDKVEIKPYKKVFPK